MDQFNHTLGRNNYASVGQAYNHKLYESANAHLYNPNEKVKESIYDHNIYGDPSVKTKIDVLLLIDSSDRDHTKYPDPDKYKIKLKNVYKDVTSIELISADFPQSSYTVNEYNNTIRYQQTTTQVHDGTYSEITIPVGNWPVYHPTDTDICELIVAAFQANDACFLEYGQPDIVVYGKAMGNGYAISAIVGKKDVMDMAQETFISSTFWTERIGFVAALKTIEIIRRERVWKHLIRIGTKIGDGWEKLAKKHNLMLHVTDFKPLITMKLEYGNLNSAIATLFTQEMLKRGYLAALSVYVSYSHGDSNVNRYLENVDEVFRYIAEAITTDTVEERLETKIRDEGFKRLN